MPKVPLPSLDSSAMTAIVERRFATTPVRLYAAFTTGFELWFAQPGTLSMVAESGAAWFFYNREDWGRHPHYGRFLALELDRLIETTWLTGNGTQEGTCGAETVLRIELISSRGQTLLRLHHSGFVSEQSRDGHAANWPLALDELAVALESQSRGF